MGSPTDVVGVCGCSYEIYSRSISPRGIDHQDQGDCSKYIWHGKTQMTTVLNHFQLARTEQSESGWLWLGNL